MILREAIQLRSPGARSILAQYLADDASGCESGKTRQIDGRFSVSDALQHAAIARAERWNMSGAVQVGRDGFRVDGDLNRPGTVLRAHARRDAETLVGIDADGERRAVLLSICLTLLREIELVRPLTGERQADPSACFPDHEVDQLGRDELRRANEVALVLAILVVRDDDQLACLDIG